jgi:hypothetical protein
LAVEVDSLGELNYVLKVVEEHDLLKEWMFEEEDLMVNEKMD